MLKAYNLLLYIYLATNQTDEMPSLTFTFLIWNKIEAACQKKEYCHHKTVQKFIRTKMHRPQKPTAFGLSAPQKKYYI